MIFEEKPSEQLKTFISDYSDLIDINPERGQRICEEAIKYYHAEDVEKDSFIYQQFLESEWYEPLRSGEIDYDVYNEKYYFSDTWACWAMLSRGYLKAILKNNTLPENRSLHDELKQVGTIADLGCGLGYTTAGLKQIFPDAKVYGTNLKNTDQWKYCEIMAEKYDFELVESCEDLGQIDLIFASEYFEHIQAVLNHLENLISTNNPHFFILANSFNTISVGHFKIYEYGNENFQLEKIESSKISRRFNKTLRDKGYKQQKTRLWNNRPAFWKSENES